MTARESRGVQVEARTLSGVQRGQRIQGSDAMGTFDGTLLRVLHDETGEVDLRVLEGRRPGRVTLAATDLVTLTDGGA